MSTYEYQKEWRRKNAERMRVYHKRYRETHKEEFRKRDAEYYQKNKEHLDALNKQWAKEHPEERKKYVQKSDRKHQHKRTEAQRIRLKKISKAALTKIHRNNIQEFYKNCPKGMEVDHIIPLQNDQVCGLHAPWNLQYLTVRENAVKNNRFDGTYENERWRQRM